MPWTADLQLNPRPHPSDWLLILPWLLLTLVLSRTTLLLLKALFHLWFIWIYLRNFINVSLCHCPCANYPGNTMSCSYFLKVATFSSWEMIEAWKTQGTSRIFKAQEAYEIYWMCKALPQGYIIFKVFLRIRDYKFRADCNLIQPLWVFTHSGVDCSVP